MSVNNKRCQKMLLQDDLMNKKLKRTIDDASDEFLCPITLKLPFHPVIAEDGRIYERDAIEQWFKSGLSKCDDGSRGIKSPVTNVAMGATLIEATQVKNMIELLVSSGAVHPEKAADWTQLLSERRTFNLWRAKAESEHVESMMCVGNAYRQGTHGVIRCVYTAVKWFIAAVKLGHLPAFTELKLTQSEVCPHPYMARQVAVTCSMREILIDWLVEVHFLLGFKQTTLFLAISLVDRYGGSTMLIREKLQLIGVSALLLACKSKCEPDPPDARYLAHLTANAYSSFEVDAMEAVLIRKFGSPVHAPTSHDFFVEALKQHKIPTNGILQYRASFYLEQALLSHDMLSFLPSILASAAVLLSIGPCYVHYFQMQLKKKKKLMIENEKAPVLQQTVLRRSQRISIRNGKTASSSSPLSPSSSPSSSLPSATVASPRSVLNDDGQAPFISDLIDEELTYLETVLLRLQTKHQLQELHNDQKEISSNSSSFEMSQPFDKTRQDLYALVEYGWIQMRTCHDLFGHSPVEVMACAIAMAKEVCRPPHCTPQKRILDSVVKKYSDVVMKSVATQRIHPCVYAVARRSIRHTVPPLPSSSSSSSSSSSFVSGHSEISTVSTTMSSTSSSSSSSSLNVPSLVTSVTTNIVNNSPTIFSSTVNNRQGMSSSSFSMTVTSNGTIPLTPAIQPLPHIPAPSESPPTFSA